MAVIKKLGDRVEREHNQFLRDSQRIEDKSAIKVNGAASSHTAGPVDFESLVAGANGATVKADTALDAGSGWEDDVWGSILTPSVDVRSYWLSLKAPLMSIHRPLVRKVQRRPRPPRRASIRYHLIHKLLPPRQPSRHPLAHLWTEPPPAQQGP